MLYIRFLPISASLILFHTYSLSSSSPCNSIPACAVATKSAFITDKFNATFLTSFAFGIFFLPISLIIEFIPCIVLLICKSGELINIVNILAKTLLDCCIGVFSEARCVCCVLLYSLNSFLSSASGTPLLLAALYTAICPSTPAISPTAVPIPPADLSTLPTFVF